MNRLAEIFAHKRDEVAAAKSLISLATLQGQRRPPRAFLKAIQDDPRPVGLIAEVKKASPSQGLIRGDFDPVAIAQTYQAAGATCLSVLTDERYFQGRPENLQLIRDVVSLPLLRKDFINDPYQIHEALAWGADCILLIVAAFAGANPIEPKGVPLMKDLFAEAKAYNLSVLVEVHNDVELDFALNLEADFIGVNNRNLMTFETDLATSEDLIPRIGAAATAVAESALRTHGDVERVARAGARAVLVGTTFCASADVAASVAEVMAW